MQQFNGQKTVQAFIAIGSNLGNRLENIQTAANILGEQTGIKIIDAAPCYESAPVGNTDQPWFLNTGILVETTLAPEQLLILCLATEHHLGRVRNIDDRYGPRTIDLDIIFYADFVISTPQLTLPHPAMIDRGFVLAPMADICPDWVHPKFKLSIRQLYSEWENLQAYAIEDTLVKGGYWFSESTPAL